MTKTATKTPMFDELDSRQARLAELRHADREAGRRREALIAEGTDLKDRIVAIQAQALASGDDSTAEVERLRARAAEIVAGLEDTETGAVARQAVKHAEQRVAAFATANVVALLAEITPEAERARDALVSAWQEAQAASKAWAAVYERVSRVLALAEGRNPRDELPVFEPNEVRTALRDALAAGVPLPLPRTQQTVRIVNYDNPSDPAHGGRRRPAGEAPIGVYDGGVRIA